MMINTAYIVVAWRKAKKKVSDKLGLEEKTNKEVEEDIVVTDEQETEQPAEDAVDENSESKPE